MLSETSTSRLVNIFLILGPVPHEDKVKVIKKYINTDEIIDETLMSLLCLPNIDWQDKQLEPKFHTFLVTREDGQRLYGSGLTVYDQPNYIINSNNSSSNNQNGNRKFATYCYCIITNTPFINATRALLNIIWEKKCDDTLVRCVMHIRLPPRRRCLRLVLPPKAPSTTNNQLTMSQATTITTTTNQTTQQPGQQFNNNRSKLSTLRSKFHHDDIYLYRGLTDLPLFDYPLREVFKFLNIDDFLVAFACVLMEQRTLIISQDNYRLMMVGESLTNLLLPLRWCHVYVPILPPIYGANYLDAPTPYIMGINTNLTKLPAHLNYVQCIIYCDESLVVCNADSLVLPPFFDELKEELLSIFKKYDNSIDNFKPPVVNANRRHSSSSVINGDITVNGMTAAPELKSFTYLDDLKFNQTVRVAFMKTIRRNILTNYERFIVDASDSQVDIRRFDVVSYLCDQPEFMRSFLSTFLETQMFVSFIDESAKRIQQYKYSSQSSLRIYDIDPEDFSLQFNDQQLNQAFGSAVRVHLMDLRDDEEHNLEVKMMPASPMKVRRRNPAIHASIGNHKSLDINIAVSMPNHLIPSPPISMTPTSPMVKQTQQLTPTSQNQVNQQVKLVELLLKEVKNKTKRIIIDKMGLDDDGFDNPATHNSNLACRDLKGENALIGSLCDLIERIWSHGAFGELLDDSRCSLWTHLIAYARLKYLDTKPAHDFTDGSNLDILATTNSDMSELDSLVRNSFLNGIETFKSRTVETLKPLPNILLYDLRTIQSLGDVKTEVGKGRAFIRLALERKLLSKHLKTLLSDQTLLSSLYKRYSFLRCEEEREQFLTHLLTLNAVDLPCFSNTFTTSTLQYTLYVFGSSTNFSAWFRCVGTASTSIEIAINSQSVCVFRNRNFGDLKSLTIGVNSSKVHIDFCCLRNDATGHLYKFVCNKWIGKNIVPSTTQLTFSAEKTTLQSVNEAIVKLQRSRSASTGKSWLRYPAKLFVQK